MSVILFFMRISRKGEPRQGTTYIASNALFLTVCGVEIIYALSTEFSMWFCEPNQVGWKWTVINFFLLSGIMYNQILYLRDIMDDVFAKGQVECDLKLGLYSWIGAFGFLIIFAIFYKPAIPLVLGVLSIFQLVQIAFILKGYGNNYKGGFFAIFVYLMGTIATAVALIVLIGILILVVMFVAVAWFVLKATGVGSSGSSSSGANAGERCSSCTYYPGYGRNCNYNGKSRMVNENTTACSYWRRS